MAAPYLIKKIGKCFTNPSAELSVLPVSYAPEKSKGSRAAVARLCHWKCCTSFGLLICLTNCGLTAWDNFTVGNIVIRPPAAEILYIERIEDQ